MAYEVVLKKRFVNKLYKVLTYLEEQWSNKEAADFLAKVDRRLVLLAQQPHLGAPSSKIKSVRGVLVTRHNRMYYKIVRNKVIILNMYDTRMHPGKRPY
jgi:plasmid stabilization system protein ParE